MLSRVHFVKDQRRFLFAYLFLVVLFAVEYFLSPSIIPNYPPIQKYRIILPITGLILIFLSYYFKRYILIFQILFLLLFSLTRIDEILRFLPKIHSPDLSLSLFIFSNFLTLFILIFFTVFVMPKFLAMFFLIYAIIYEFFYFQKLKDLSLLVFILILAVTIASAIISILIKNERNQKKKIRALYDGEVELNKKIALMKGRLYEQERFFSLSTLTAGIAHELGNPINFLNGNLYFINDYMLSIMMMIDRKSLNKEKREKLDKIDKDLQEIMKYSRTGFENITRIIDNMKILYSNKQNGREKVDLRDMLIRTIDFFKVSHNKNPYLINTELLPDLYLEIKSGEYYIVFSNILNNALEAISLKEEKGIISVSAESDNNYIKVSISDNGCGISDNEIKDIFNPFYTTKNGDQNLGLGLALCREIVEADQGYIKVKSEINKGTIVNIFIKEFKDV